MEGGAGAGLLAGSDWLVNPDSLPHITDEQQTSTTVEQLLAGAYVSRIAAELDRTRNFFHYTLNRRQAEFSEVVFVGGRSVTPEVMEELRNRLGMPVTSLAFQDMIDKGLFKERRGASWLGDERADEYAVAIGLALREV